MSGSLSSLLTGTALLFAYYLFVVALLPMALFDLTRIPRELARKLHHVAYGLSIFLLLELFEQWYLAVAAAATLVVVAYPTLPWLERRPFFKRSFVQRSGERYEFRRQLLLVQASFALLLAATWGLLGSEYRYLAAAAAMAWAFGDAAAALVGKAFGRHAIDHELVDDGKTHEGSAAMTVVACAALFLTLFWFGGVPWWAAAVAAVLVAPLAAAVELISPAGTDTLSVPVATLVALYPLLSLLKRLAT